MRMCVYVCILRILGMRAILHFLSTQYILLTIGTMLHGRSLDLFLSSNCNFMPAEPQSPFSTSLTQWQPPLYVLLLWVLIILYLNFIEVPDLWHLGLDSVKPA